MKSLKPSLNDYREQNNHGFIGGQDSLSLKYNPYSFTASVFSQNKFIPL